MKIDFRNTGRLLLPTLLLLSAWHTAAAQGKAPFTLAAAARLQSISSPALAPDGRTVAAVRSRTDYENDSRRTEVVLISVADGSMQAVANGSSPQWSPDGQHLAYFGRNGAASGLFIYDVTGGASRFLAPVYFTDHFLGHRARKNFAWSPDGQWIAYVGAEGPAQKKPADAVRVYRRILYKTRTSFSDNRLTHIWLVPAAGGEARALTPGPYNEHSLTWSPDSKQIAFVSNRTPDPDNNHNNDLWRVDLATGATQRLTDTPGTEFQPAWSPDGKWIACLATVRARNTKDSPPENTQAYVLPAGGGAARCLTAALDRRVSAVQWHPGGKFVYFTAGDRGKTVIFRTEVKSATVTPVVAGRFSATQADFDARGKSMVFVRSDMTTPAELWLAAADGRNARALTRLNREFVQSVAIQDAEPFWFESFDQLKIQGWLMKPVGFTPGKKYPLLLYVHGGPHGMYGYRFSSRLQLPASRGYAVLFINPRGSRGYGQAFADGCVMNWGGGDYHDLMAGVDSVLAQHAWVDPERLGVIGGSYGGFMTNWIITQTTRFKAAVAVASLSNLVSFYGTSLYQLLIEVEFNGLPWDNYDLLWQWSPLKHIKNVTTPTLLIHGEADHDVPVAQAEEMFIALKKRGIETELVRYPGEGHGFRRPKNIADYSRRVLAWFDRHLKSGQTSSSP